jgi:hypothetical protein
MRHRTQPFVVANHCHRTIQDSASCQFIEELFWARVESLSSKGWKLHFWLAILLRFFLFLCCFSSPTCFDTLTTDSVLLLFLGLMMYQISFSPFIDVFTACLVSQLLIMHLQVF